MSSLRELCYQNIATSIYNIPPHLQEMVIGETKERIREQVREELINEIKAEEKARKEMLSTITYLVPDIMKDIILAMTNNNENRKDFYQIWSNIPVETISAAIQIAENAVSEMEDRYVYTSFSNRNNNVHMEYHDSSYDSSYENDWSDED